MHINSFDRPNNKKYSPRNSINHYISKPFFAVFKSHFVYSSINFFNRLLDKSNLKPHPSCGMFRSHSSVLQLTGESLKFNL